MQSNSHKWLPKSLELACQLINARSVEPHDGGCQDFLARRLETAGFTVTRLEINAVKSLWAEIGANGSTFAFLAHTDVVPPGELELWQTDPFSACVHDGMLYGRGACDMKGALAAFIAAAENFVSAHKGVIPFRLGIVAAGDEEREESHGTLDVLTLLESEKRRLDFCLVGEPTSQRFLGDCIKIGRRGSLSAHFKINGRSGHAAYPEQALNPITQALKVLSALDVLSFDQGNADFPPTTLQLTALHSGSGASNIIPASATGSFNLRFSNECSSELLRERCEEVFSRSNVSFDLKWSSPAQPYLSKRGLLVNLLIDTLQDQLRMTPALSTAGGTSDGRFAVAHGAEVVEFGLLNTTIHQPNERTAVSDLFALTQVYRRLLENLAHTLPAAEAHRDSSGC